MSHRRKNSVRDKVIGKKWIYSDTEGNTLHRESVGYHTGWVWPWNLAWLVFIGWVISYANKWEDYSSYFGDLNPCGWDRAMVERHYQLNGHEFEQALGVGDRQRVLQFMWSQRVGRDWATELNWFWGRGRYFQDLGHYPLLVLNNALELSWHLWVCHFTCWSRIKV